jgi:hypothetical protein
VYDNFVTRQVFLPFEPYILQQRDLSLYIHNLSQSTTCKMSSAWLRRYNLWELPTWATDVRCYATACWFHFHGNQQYVTTQQYCNAITRRVFSWSVHTQQSVAMQRMTQLWSDQSGFQWVCPEPMKGMHRPNQSQSQSLSQQSAVSSECK